MTAVAAPCIVDYSFARPAPAAIAAAGYVGAARYLAPLPNPKVLTAPELAGLLEAGLSVTLVWESGAQRAALSGYQGGQRDASRAVALALELGAPAGAGIYYVLEDPTRLPESSWPDVFAYAQGVAAVGGPYRPGGYGSQALLEEAHRRGLIELLWQVGGWSPSVSMVGHLYQRLAPTLGPVPGTDENACLRPDWGQWPLPTVAPPPAASDAHQEDLVATLMRTPSDGKVWCVSAAGRFHIHDAALELPLVEWNIVRGADVQSLTPEQEPAFLLIPEIR